MKKGKLTRFAIVLALLSLTGCGNAAESNETNTEAVKVDSETEEITETEITPNLPDDLDFEGHAFTILNNSYGVPGWSQRDIDAEEIDGSPINDAVYKRNINVEDKYNCKVESMQSGEVHNVTMRTVNAQDDSIDIVTPFFWCGQIGNDTLSGYYVDLKSVDSIDLSNPWYDQKSVKDLEIMNRLFFVTSDLTIGDEIATSGMVFNKQLYDDYGYNTQYGDIYQIVRDGEWDFETLKSMVLAISDDIDGNGTMDDKDRYGLLYQRDTLQSFINGFEMRNADKDNDGVPYYTLISDQNSNKLDGIFSFLYTKNNCFHVMNYFDGTSTDFTTGMCNMFINNQAMFMWIRFADVEMLRTMDVDFGIIPVPKYDEAQDSYYNCVNNFMGVATTIPRSCYDVEKVGMFLEAICCESRKELTPAYYNVTLQGKITRDEESRDMLDLIFENRAFDIGDIYNFGGFSEKVYRMSQTYNSDYASLYAKNEKLCQKMLDKFISDYSEIE